MKVICFVLPEASNHPIGGYKISFEYANRLVESGYKVKILFLNESGLKRYPVPKFVKHTFENFRTKREPRWFKLNSNIEKISSTKRNYKRLIEDVDVAIATAVTTAYPVKKLFPNSKKLYLIQDFEDWGISPEFVCRTYGLGYTNIVVSKWLKHVVDKYSRTPSIYIQNPLNTDKYRVINPIEKRNKYLIGMLYHESPIKGCKYSIEAIKKVKKKHPQVKLLMFGAYDPPRDLPSWVSYYKNASSNKTIEIYNSISIFVSGSIKEGFGLTGLESMACGSALVSSNYRGVQEYAINGHNALLSPIKDSDGLANNIIKLIEDNSLREKIAYNGVKTAQDFSWKKAYKKFENTISNLD